MASTSLLSLLTTLTESIKSALDAPPPKSAILSVSNGISLLDTKNELLLSYLQSLAFLIYYKLQNLSNVNGNGLYPLNHDPEDGVLKKLVELRVYLEKGVRPLENRLKYQIDKVLRATTDEDARGQTIHSDGIQAAKKRGKSSTRATLDDSDASSDNDFEPTEHTPLHNLSELSYRPNLASLARTSQSTLEPSPKASSTPKADSIYRPPRINPTALPVTEQSNNTRRNAKPQKSSTMEEYIAQEMSTAPISQPSIGSTIVKRGRKVKSDKERAVEKEKRDYEETNFVRLPAASKKEKKMMGGGKRRAEWGGEEFAGLGEGADRIGNLLAKRKKTRRKEV
ncbi:hypothetical protein MMC25_007509 [Agyrium rufum]|nr:hypothetical protein [Agyrium rufum]